MKIITEIQDLPNMNLAELSKMNIALAGDALHALAREDVLLRLDAVEGEVEALHYKVLESETKIETALDAIEDKVSELVATFKESKLESQLGGLQTIKLGVFGDLHSSLGKLKSSIEGAQSGAH